MSHRFVLFALGSSLLLVPADLPAHKVDPPVHQHIAEQALTMLPPGPLRSELLEYLGTVGTYVENDTTDGRLLEGVFDEDAFTGYLPGTTTVEPPACPFAPISARWRFWRHGWDPDGGYEDGFLHCDSSVELAHRYWLEAIDAYKNDRLPRAFWWLGRVVHLLEDKSVPAHTHVDEHGPADDNYEEFMGRNSLGWPDSGDECSPPDIATGGCNYQEYLYDEAVGLFSPPDAPGEPTSPVDYRAIDFDISPWNAYSDSWTERHALDPEVPDTPLFRLFLNLAELGDQFESDQVPGEDAAHPDNVGDVPNDHLRWHGRELMKAAFEHVAGLYLLFWDSVGSGIEPPDSSHLVELRWNPLDVTVEALEGGIYELRLIDTTSSGWTWANTQAGPVSLAAGESIALRFDVFPESPASSVELQLWRKSALQVFQQIERVGIELHASGPDTTPPQVLETSPEDDGTLSPSSAIRVYFSEDMNGASFLASRVSIVGSTHGPYGKIVFYDAATRSATIRPTGDLQVGERVTMTLDQNIADLSGNDLDGDGDGSPGPGQSFRFDVALPGALDAPTDLSAIAFSGPEVLLSWSDRASAEQGFRLWRSVQSGIWSLIATLSANTQGYTDSSVVAGNTYSYRVRAFNSSGQSADSNIASVSLTGDAFVPDPPLGLTATAVSSDQINLSWQDRSSNESGFKVERRDPSGSWFQISTTGAGTTFYASAFLDGDTFYSYRVRAYNAAGSSAYSNVASALTESNAPRAPSNLVAWALSDTRIALTWQDRSNNENGFEIERRSEPSGSWSVTGYTGRDDATFEDSVSPDTEYAFRVRAQNTEGYSPYSNTATVSSCVAPATPRLDSPYDGEDELPTALDLEWDTDDEVSTYDVYFGPSQPPSFYASLPPDLASSNTRVSVSGLSEGQVYYWQVVAQAACDPALVTASQVRRFVTLGAPGPVDLLKPVDGAVDVPTGVVLDWANVSSDGPTLYNLYLDTSSPPAFFEEMGTRTEKLVTGLDANRTYYWQVVARAAANPALTSTSPIWSFTTGAGSSTTVMLDAVEDAGLRGAAFANRNYGGQVGGPAEQRSFGTGNNDGFYLDPGSAPLRGALRFDLSTIPSGVSVTNATLTLEFAGSSGSQTSPLDIYFDPYSSGWSESSVTWNSRPGRNTSHRVTGVFPTSGFNPLQNDLTPLVQKWMDQTLPNYGFEVSMPALESTTKSKHFFQKEWSASLAAELQVTYEVPCEAPGAPIHLSPADAATGQPPMVALDWSDENGASSYNVYVDTVNPPAGPGMLTTSSDLSLTGLMPATTYYWRVEALANCDPSITTTTTTWSFTTASCFPPAAVNLSAPAHQASSQPRQTSLSWQAVAGAASYEILFGTQNPPATALGSTAGTSFMVTTEPDSDYFWQVRALAACDPTLVSESAIRIFSTASAPTADAGADHTLEVGDSTPLGGSPPANGGLAPYSYSWSVSPSAGASLSSASAPNPSFTADAAGIYVVQLVVTDARNFSSAISEAVLDIAEPPQISVTPTSLDFGRVRLGATAELTFEVENIGEGILTGAVSVTAPFTVVSGETFALGPAEVSQVTLRFTPSTVGPVATDAVFTGGGGLVRPLMGEGIDEHIFSDGFESGDTLRWTRTQQLLRLVRGVNELRVELVWKSFLATETPHERLEILSGWSVDGKKILSVELEQDNDSNLVRIGVSEGSRSFRWSDWALLERTETRLELFWRRAWSPAYHDGEARLGTENRLWAWIDQTVDHAELMELRAPALVEVRIQSADE